MFHLAWQTSLLVRVILIGINGISGLTVGTAGGEIGRNEQSFQKASAHQYVIMLLNLPPGGLSPVHQEDYGQILRGLLMCIALATLFCQIDKNSLL
jgi:Ca2+/H+ antiporter